MECPPEERQRRIIERDRRWQTQVIRYWDLHQITLAAVVGEDRQYDLILDGMVPLAKNVESMIALLDPAGTP